MRISSEFNRLYHGAFLGNLHKQMINAHLLIMDFEDFKEELKRINENYPIENGKHISTRDISNKDLVQHIEFIIMWAGEYGFTPQTIDDEWNRLMSLVNG